MRSGKFVIGCASPILASVLGVLTAVAVINSGWIMFDAQNQNLLTVTLICPLLIELIIYFAWFIIKIRGDSRNKDKLAKSSLLVGIPSIAASCLLLFGIATIYSLWEEGSLFLVIAAILYGIAGVIQYSFCRPY